MRHQFIFFSALLLLPYNAHAGFDLGPVGNSLFWVGLAMWSAGISWMLYSRREKIGKRVFGTLRAVFAPHTRTTIVLSSPKYRPYVQTSHVVDSLERAAESFLSAAKTGVHDAKNASREALSILEHDARAALRAAEIQARSLRKGTTLYDRVKNIKRLLTKKSVVQKNSPQSSTPAPQRLHISHNEMPSPAIVDDEHHTRHKVKVLSDAHRALIRARNAQHDLPDGGIVPEHVHAYTAQQQQSEHAPNEPHISARTVSSTQLEPTEKRIQTHTDTVKEIVKHDEKPQHKPVERVQIEPARAVMHHAAVEVPISVPTLSTTKDELVLDTSGLIPRLVLTRKSH